MSIKTQTKHLDIGCGAVPRNPYYQEQVYAVDTRSLTSTELPSAIHYTQANFATEPLPFPDNFFESISAYDVIEHIPRQLLQTNGKIIYPFIMLMNEIYRVLKPNGLFLTTTPGYPRPEAFQDPTHVNIITIDTLSYFSGKEPLARMYGFNGNFETKINKFCIRNNYYDRKTSSIEIWRRRWHRKVFKNGWPHIIWEIAKTSN